MLKIYWSLGLFLGVMSSLWAQQLPQYSLYMLNPYGYHSAYAGLDNSLSVTGVFRKQWVGFPGSPMSFQINAHMPIAFLHSGVGIALENDRLGAEINTGVRLSYNYILDLKKAGQLSIGAAGGWFQKGIDGSLLRAPDGNYEGSGVNHNDDFIPSIKTVTSTFSAEGSIYYKHKLIEVGLSLHHLPAPLLAWESGALQKIRYKQHLTTTISGNIKLTDDFTLRPTLLIKTDFIKVQPELALILKYKSIVFGGLGFRGYSKNTQDAVVILAGVEFAKHFRIAYSYDFSISKLKSFNSGSHEVVINYNLHKDIGKGIPPKIIYNPRFL